MQALDVCFSWCAIRSHEDQALWMSVLNRRRSSQSSSEKFAAVIENTVGGRKLISKFLIVSPLNVFTLPFSFFSFCRAGAKRFIGFECHFT